MTVKALIQAMLGRQHVIARKFGCSLSETSKQWRVLNLSILALIAVVVKTLIDQGVITGAQLMATMDEARDDAYDDEPVNPAQ